MGFELVLLLLGLGAPSSSGEPQPDPWQPPLLAVTEVPSLCETMHPIRESETAVLELRHQAWPRYVANVGDVTLTIGLDAANRVRFVSTSSPEFATPDGVSVGWAFEDLEERFDAEVTCDARFVCYVELPSGWFAGFSAKEARRGKAIVLEAAVPGAEDRVTFLFKSGECDAEAR